MVGCSPWGCKESDMTEQLTHTHSKVDMAFYGKYMIYVNLKIIFSFAEMKLISTLISISGFTFKAKLKQFQHKGYKIIV